MSTTVSYIDLPFSKIDLQDDPIQQFGIWFEQAKANQELEPTAMTLATVNQNYEISARMVLLKGHDHRGFVFFTNYDSLKGHDLREISRAALVFWWPKCQRQVRITGDVSMLNEIESDAYFDSRDRERRIAAIASKQSAPVADRHELLEQVSAVEQKYSQVQHIPRPAFWGGYVLKPLTIEFWQGRAHRLHDRFEYRRVGEQWEVVQLSP